MLRAATGHLSVRSTHVRAAKCCVVVHFSSFNSLFVNSPGTGKTRLLYEGLTERWGLYIPCSITPRVLGSVDMSSFFKNAIHEKPAPGEYTTAFERVLLVRLVIFRLFLECLPDAQTDEHRTKWLLLQLLPSVIAKDDIFFDLANRLERCEPSDGFLRRKIADTLNSIRRMLGRDEPIYCVVDDAEYPDVHRARVFGPSTSLREMARTWENLEGLTLILGVDALMDMARTMVNVVGNCLATVVVAQWEGEFQEASMETLQKAAEEGEI